MAVRMVNIIKGKLQQQVSEQAFEKLFKPNGWIVDEGYKPQADETHEMVLTMSESNAKNLLADKKRTLRAFDDKIFKSEV